MGCTVRLGVFAVVASCLWAARANADDDCRDLLVHGIYDSSRDYIQSQAASAIDRQLCETYNRYTEDAIHGQAQASYGLFSGSLAIGKDAIEAIGKSMCSRDASSASSQNLVTRASLLLNANAISAWQACTQARDGRGLRSTWRFREDDQRFVSLEIEYVPPPGGASDIAVSRVAISPGYGFKCDGQLLSMTGRSIRPSTKYSMSCERFVYPKPKLVGPIGEVWAEPASIEIDTAAGQLRTDMRAIRSSSPAIKVPVPVGTVIAYMGAVAHPNDLPTGWLLCDGSSVSRSRYPTLARVLGVRPPAAGGADVFNLPNLSGVFLRGFDPRGIVDKGILDRDTSDGRKANEVGSLESFATALPKLSFATANDGAHSHSLDVETTAGRSDGTVKNTIANPGCCGSPQKGVGGGDHSHKITSGGDAETRPVNVAVNYIIKALSD